MNKKELLKQYPDIIKEIAGEMYTEHVQSWGRKIKFDETFNKYVKEQTQPEWRIEGMRMSSDSPTYIVHMLTDEGIKERLKNGHHIYSVKRLSDGEVFSVGDKVKYKSGRGLYGELTIDRIIMRDNRPFMKYQADVNLYDDWLCADFQKIKKPEWIILSFKHSNGLTTLREDGSYIWERAEFNSKGATLNEILNNPKYSAYTIHSVKRVSDGEVFTVGDRVHFGNPNAKSKEVLTIKSFEIRPDMMGFYYNESSKLQLLLNIKYANKITPLFTTEGGVEIYKGDSYVKVNNHLDWSIATGFVADGHHDAIGLKFSTKEAAEEYILMNKPALSVNDLLNYPTGNFSKEDFIEYIKTKIGK